jgi:hypothetical protein
MPWHLTSIASNAGLCYNVSRMRGVSAREKGFSSPLIEHAKRRIGFCPAPLYSASPVFFNEQIAVNRVVCPELGAW